MAVLSAESLRRFATAVFSAMGAPEEVAAKVAHHLVLSNLSGHDSHGVLRIPLYVQMFDLGSLLPARLPEIVRESPVSTLVDAHRGFGQYSTLFTLERSMEKAASAGVAVGAVRHSTHTGRLGTYSEIAAGRGFVCIVTSGSAGPGYGLVAPFGGAGRFLSTNPWTVGIPAGPTRSSFIYDAATTTIAEGKNRLAQVKGVRVPAGALVDVEGQPTTDPEDLYRGGTLTPLGGVEAGHKGYGYSMAAAFLGALAIIGDPDPTSAGALGGFSGAAGVFVTVVNPALFGDADEYARLVARTLDDVKKVNPRPGVAEVLYPGEPEARARELRAVDGIPVPEALWREFTGIGQRFGVEFPESNGL